MSTGCRLFIYIISFNPPEVQGRWAPSRSPDTTDEETETNRGEVTLPQLERGRTRTKAHI